MTKTVTVSDHAVLRWLERAYAIDVEYVRRQIEAQCEPAVRAGAVSLATQLGTFCFRGSGVTTFLAPGMKRQRAAEDQIRRGGR